MNIAGIKGTQAVPQKLTRQQAEDPAIKSLQSQIDELQKQLQQLSKDDSGDEQALADKRKEIQQKISDLNSQIRSRQAEMRREKQQPKEVPKQENPMTGSTNQKGGVPGLSLAGAGSLIAASNGLKLSQAVNGQIVKSEAKTAPLKSEIKLDKQRGVDTAYKEKELAKVQDGIARAKDFQADINEKTEDSLKGQKSEKTDDSKNSEENDEKEIKTEGKYDKEGNLKEEKDPERNDYEDKA